MKRFWSIVLAALFVAATVVPSMADFSIGGAVIMSGYRITNNNLNKDENSKYYNQEIGVKFDGKNDDKAGAHVRLVLGQNVWDKGSQTSDTANIGIDYAYGTFPIGGFKVIAGYQPVNFGNKVFVNDVRLDRLRIMKKTSFGVAGIAIDKLDEDPPPASTFADKDDKDIDQYGLILINKKGASKFGVLVQSKQNAVASKSDMFITAFFNRGSLQLDLQQKSGDSFDDTQLGIFAHYSKKLESGSTVGVKALYGDNGANASPNYSALPGVIGNSDDDHTAINALSMSKAAFHDNQMAVALYGQFKAGDQWTVTAGLASLTIKGLNSSDDLKATVIGGEAKYAIGEQTSLALHLSNASTDNSGDETRTALGATFKAEF